MFLLNKFILNRKVYFDKFTIQNVSIKFWYDYKLIIIIKYLQYKMFLLNCYIYVTISEYEVIYNTKCFY